MSQEYNLQRFVDAQARVVDTVTRELRDGAKRSHWMWFVFPQIKGLGRSSTAQHYAIGSLEEAKAYLEHPVLGKRLREWTEILLGLEGSSAEQIFGYPDYLKFRSSMTLFSRVPGAPDLFQRALDTYYGGKPDQATLRLLGESR